MTIKLQLFFLVCVIFALVLGRPDNVDTGLDPFKDTEAAVSGRMKREDCGWKYGCHKGYCWSNCKGGFGVLVFDGDGPEWCYTTKKHSQSYEYVRCSKKSDCDGCWHCAGSCTV